MGWGIPLSQQGRSPGPVAGPCPLRNAASCGPPGTAEHPPAALPRGKNAEKWGRSSEVWGHTLPRQLLSPVESLQMCQGAQLLWGKVGRDPWWMGCVGNPLAHSGTPDQEPLPI